MLIIQFLLLLIRKDCKTSVSSWIIITPTMLNREPYPFPRKEVLESTTFYFYLCYNSVLTLSHVISVQSNHVWVGHNEATQFHLSSSDKCSRFTVCTEYYLEIIQRLIALWPLSTARHQNCTFFQ